MGAFLFSITNYQSRNKSFVRFPVFLLLFVSTHISHKKDNSWEQETLHTLQARRTTVRPTRVRRTNTICSVKHSRRYTIFVTARSYVKIRTGIKSKQQPSRPGQLGMGNVVQACVARAATAAVEVRKCLYIVKD